MCEENLRLDSGFGTLKASPLPNTLHSFAPTSDEETGGDGKVGLDNQGGRGGVWSPLASELFDSGGHLGSEQVNR